jgi:hypothetical protein
MGVCVYPIMTGGSFSSCPSWTVLGLTYLARFVKEFNDFSAAGRVQTMVFP